MIIQGMRMHVIVINTLIEQAKWGAGGSIACLVFSRDGSIPNNILF